MPPQWDPSLFWMAGILVGLFWLDESARRSGLDRRRTFLCGLAVVVSGWLGARLVGLGAYHDPELGLMGGRSWFGGMLGGLTAALIAARLSRLRLSFHGWMGQRLRCVSATLSAESVARERLRLRGTPSALPWAIHYGQGFPAFEKHVQMGWIPAGAVSSLGVHPVQLYAALGALVLFGGVISMRRLRFVALLAGYAVLRLLLEPFRGDSQPVLTALSQTQLFALCALAVSCVLFTAFRAGRFAVRPT